MAQQQSIVVSQYHNPKYNPEQGEDKVNNPKMVYNVEKAVNTLVVSCNDYLTPARVQDLIDNGISVTIQKVK